MPVIVSGGLDDGRGGARAPTSESGADAVMIARGALGNPWIFEELTGRRASGAADARARSSTSCCGRWTAPRSTWARERAARYLRKFYPWYLERLGVRGRDADAFQRTESLDEARELLAALGRPLAVAA